ncbi:DUF1620 super [Gonapodya sp. JEL0774]|nr:DUF1620 super [Gonapodya sp. JEL0774]
MHLWKRALFLGVVLAGLLGGANAIYKDQIGVFDWHKEVVGIPSFSFFREFNRNSLLFVATKQNVVAALSASSGDVQWRHKIEEGALWDFQAIGEAIIVATGTTTLKVRAWDMVSGTFLWEYVANTPGTVSSVKLAQMDDTKVSVTTNLETVVLQLRNGFVAATGATETPSRPIPASQKPKNPASLSLKVNPDGTIQTYDGPNVLWTRDESLALAVDAVFVDLPEEQMFSLEHTELGKSCANALMMEVRHRKLLFATSFTKDGSANATPLERYIKRWTIHIAKLMALTPLEMSSHFWGSPREKTNVLYRDSFGFRKLAVILAANGKVIALDTDGGRTVWSVYLEGLQGRKLEVLRSTAVKFPPVLAVVGKSTKTGTPIRILNGITGEDFTTGQDPFNTASAVIKAEVTTITKLPIEELSERTNVLALVDSNSKVHLFPETPAVRTAFAEFAPSFFLYDLKGENALVGRQAVVDSTNNGAFPTRETWSVDFPAGEFITTLGTPWDRRVASLGRVHGNRSVLYKYLNPNLIAVATHRRTPQPLASLYLVDTVKGAVHFSASYSVGADPEPGLPKYGHHLVQWENVVLFSFWNSGGFDKREEIVDPFQAEDSQSQDSGDKKRRKRKRKRESRAKGQEIVVLEVFESEFVDKRIESRNFSSLESAQPNVLSQAYVFPSSISAVGVTQTHAGITTREVLFGLPSGQIVGVNKKVLDPRRPYGAPSADDKEEGLVPYTPMVTINQKDTATYYLKVLGINHIISSPAFLESTSLVLGYGMDVFFTRRNPSKTFDILSEDFSRVSLLATVAALTAGIVVAKYMAQQKKLRDAWI